MRVVGVVVPTLFQRPAFLRECLESLRSQRDVHVLLMGPNVKEGASDLHDLVDQVLEEPSEGNLPLKINFAISHLPPDVKYISWLGDDDFLLPNSLQKSRTKMDNHPEAALVFGGCRYVDEDGKTIGANPSVRGAVGLARIGPFLAPQPGSLYRRSKFEQIGGLDPAFTLAFDMDLFLGLMSCGEVIHVPDFLSSFRWHADSLSVKQRSKSVQEAAEVRKKHAQGLLKYFVIGLNPIVSWVTLLSGRLLSWRLSRKND